MILLFIGVIVAAQVVPLAIPTTVVPPGRPTDPATVFLVDYGRTPSLGPHGCRQQDGRVRVRRLEVLRATEAGRFRIGRRLLWPTQGGLGRKEITGPPSADTVRAGIGAEIQQLYKLDVERHALERLQAKLDRLYHDQRSTATQSYGMIFVHHPAAYTYWSNSNHMTADWLRDLGCEIHGPAFSSSWRVRPAPP